MWSPPAATRSGRPTYCAKRAWRSSISSSCSTAAKEAKRTSTAPESPTHLFTASKTSSLTDLTIQGGTVLTPEGPREADVHVAGGVITSVDQGRQAGQGTRVVDA